MDTEVSPVKDSCKKHLQKGVRQQRYLLKKMYFDIHPLNDVPKESPITSMTNAEWTSLVTYWTDPKRMVSFSLYQSCCVVLAYVYIFSNSTILAEDLSY